jgi:hypothetical protein
MPYAIMQLGLEQPTLEQMQTAFRGVAAADARILAKNAFGILAQGLTAEEAAAARAGFTTQGVEVESVDERGVPAMPPIRHVRRVDCTPEALLIYDPIGRPVPLAWKDILLIAAGSVVMAEFDRKEEVIKLPTYDPFTGTRKVTYTSYYEQEMRRERWLLEIIIRGGALRFSINSHEASGALFQYLGDRQVQGFAGNFQLLVRDVIQYAPEAALNRGACSIRDKPPQPLQYPNRKAFNEEIIWLLWKLK